MVLFKWLKPLNLSSPLWRWMPLGKNHALDFPRIPHRPTQNPHAAQLAGGVFPLAASNCCLNIEWGSFTFCGATVWFDRLAWCNRAKVVTVEKCVKSDVCCEGKHDENSISFHQTQQPASHSAHNGAQGWHGGCRWNGGNREREWAMGALLFSST